MVPAPTAWTDAAAPPDKTLMTISILIEVLIAERMANKVNSVNDTRYMVRLPNVSENEDHHNGNIDMASIYKATERFVTVDEAWSSADNCGRVAKKNQYSG